MAASPDDLRRWIRSRRAAEERELCEARTPRSPDASLRAALGLIALAGMRHGWPLPVEPGAEAEDARAYERWARLRRLARR
jgi:hypothetical protein